MQVHVPTRIAILAQNVFYREPFLSDQLPSWQRNGLRKILMRKSVEFTQNPEKSFFVLSKISFEGNVKRFSHFVIQHTVNYTKSDIK